MLIPFQCELLLVLFCFGWRWPVYNRNRCISADLSSAVFVVILLFAHRVHVRFSAAELLFVCLLLYLLAPAVTLTLTKLQNLENLLYIFFWFSMSSLIKLGKSNIYTVCAIYISIACSCRFAASYLWAIYRSSFLVAKCWLLFCMAPILFVSIVLYCLELRVKTCYRFCPNLLIRLSIVRYFTFFTIQFFLVNIFQLVIRIQIGNCNRFSFSVFALCSKRIGLPRSFVSLFSNALSRKWKIDRTTNLLFLFVFDQFVCVAYD